ncbi:MAG TPA: SurA N-terminal domain-containing protein [Polyangia bacterium]|jgi:peptidyl-prolyl cis-trans isomerase D|nr:SurA N-terminal domain-containing protein [Polyangia bacterium]
MLEQMRKSSQSLLIYVLFGIVIAVFIINFGPQSRGGCDGPASVGDQFAARVGGDTISASDFRYGFLVLGGAQYPAQMAKQQRVKETVMDKLIERELLAQEAEQLGYAVTEEEVEDQIADSKMIGLGYPRTVGRLQKDGKFSYDLFKNFVQFEMGLTPKSFIEEQKRELLASRVRDLLRAGVTVSSDEVKAEFARKGNQVNLEYVRFAPHRYETQVAPTDAEIAAYAKTNEEALKKDYEAKKFVYEKTPKELHLRQILIKGGDGEAGKAAEKKADAIAARLKKGESFADVARQVSEDPASKAKGGDLGWRRLGTTNLTGDGEAKLLAAKTGDVVGPLKSNEGWVLMVSSGSREGDLSFDQVKLELAADKLREQQTSARAKTDALAALTKAKAEPGKTLKDLFPGAADASKTDTAKADAAKKEKAGKPGAKAGGATAEVADVPGAEETGLFSLRGGHDGAIVEGIGVSNDLAKAAFALTSEAPLAGPFDVAGSAVIVRLKERRQADMGEFEKKKLELLRDAELTKWIEVLTDWTRLKCNEAKAGKQIQVNRDMLRYEDSNEPPPYEACSARRSLGG